VAESALPAAGATTIANSATKVSHSARNALISSPSHSPVRRGYYSTRRQE
jgi:hypothetical protein